MDQLWTLQPSLILSLHQLLLHPVYYKQQSGEYTLMTNHAELLMVGMSAKTFRIGNRVVKVCNVLPEDPAITQQNLACCETEALVYRILEEHPRIARCHSSNPPLGLIELEFYPNGNIKAYLERKDSKTPEADKKRWGIQMIESISYLHSKGVRHGDLRLEQWLLDDEQSVRLSDFNGSGFDAQPTLALKERPALGLECSSHWLPRPNAVDSSEQTDLFALGSSLYELVVGEKPFAGIDDQTIETRYEQAIFPNTEGLLFGREISKCWHQEFENSKELLNAVTNTLSRK
ncbi:serine/threonine protein kinase [Exophiala aquamarina CBS 119918]|uniref:Serine/threonine protein kinase n=1 Tax=Exophiala aquamarina CBS 119918 TaxID=1182545 RepID=A0A072P5I0_9EURO|nr:serine/threonine protein kinase [Exophiala aquamarina CBS 119918]KEF50870.1 serine/threonine protein kinase [Exophiala aquamarina CBS 119918]